MKSFYTYMWLREDGSPYYVGKGTGNRAFDWRKRLGNPPPRNRIVIYPADSEQDAFKAEIALIWHYGRKDLGTGILRNLSNGGENPPRNQGGRKHSEAPKEKIRRSLVGKDNHQLGRKRTEATLEKLRKAQEENPPMLGRQHTTETKLKIGEKHKGKFITEEHRRKISEARKGKKMDPQHAAKWLTAMRAGLVRKRNTL